MGKIWLLGVLLLAGGCGVESAAGPGGAPPTVVTPGSEHYGRPNTPTPPTVAPTPTPIPPKVCPPNGAAITVGPVEAALGHRAVVLTLTNCRAKALTVNGYPAVEVLDIKYNKVNLTIAHDSSYMARDPGPKQLRLAKGESAVAVVAWSNTVTSGDPADGDFLSVARSKEDKQVVVPIWTDLGTTGKLELTAWATKLLT